MIAHTAETDTRLSSARLWSIFWFTPSVIRARSAVGTCIMFCHGVCLLFRGVSREKDAPRASPSTPARGTRRDGRRMFQLCRRSRKVAIRRSYVSCR